MNSATIDVNQTELAVEQFYSTSDESLRQQLHQYLLAVQSQPESWRWSLDWIRLNKTVQLQLFAANCLYDTLKRRFGDHNFEVGPFETVREEILAILTQEKRPRIIELRLCSCFCFCIFQSLPEIWAEPVKDLIDSQIPPKLLLQIFGLLPSEFRNFSSSVERRNSVRTALTAQISTVANFAAQVVNSSGDKDAFEGAIICIDNWIQFGSDLADWEAIILLCLGKISCSEDFIAVCSRFFIDIASNSELNHLEKFIAKLFDYSQAVLEPLVTQLIGDENEENRESIWSMTTSLCSHNAKFVVKNLSNAAVAAALQVCYQLSARPGCYGKDESVSNLPFGVWYALQEEISYLDEAEKRTTTESLQQLFHQLCKNYLAKSVFPENFESTYNAEEKEEFYTYRGDLIDVFASCYKLLGQDMQNLIYGELENLVGQQTSSTRSGNFCNTLEALLFGLECIADYVSSTSRVTCRVFGNVYGKLPFGESNRLANTAVKLISKYATVITDNQLYDSIFPVLMECINQPTTALLATLALKDITGERDPVMLPYSEALLQSCYRCLANDRISDAEKIRVVHSIGFLLSINSHQFIMAQLNVFLVPKLEKLSAASQSGSAAMNKEALLTELNMLSALMGSLDTKPQGVETSVNDGTVHPISLIASQSLPLFKQLCLTTPSDDLVVKLVCECMKKSLLTLMTEGVGLIGPYIELILMVFPQHWCVFGVVKQICLVFGGDQHLQTQLTEFLRILSERTAAIACQETVELMEEYLLTVSQVIRRHSGLVLNSNVVLMFTWEMVVRALKFNEPPVVRNAASVVGELSKNSANSTVVALMRVYGGPLISDCICRAQVEQLTNVLESLGDVIFVLLKAFPQFIGDWLKLFPPNPSLSQMFQEVRNKRKFRELLKQMNFMARRQQLPPATA